MTSWSLSNTHTHTDQPEDHAQTDTLEKERELHTLKVVSGKLRPVSGVQCFKAVPFGEVG